MTFNKTAYAFEHLYHRFQGVSAERVRLAGSNNVFHAIFEVVKVLLVVHREQEELV